MVLMLCFILALKCICTMGAGGCLKWSCSLRQALLCVHYTQCLSERDMNPCSAAKVGQLSHIQGQAEQVWKVMGKICDSDGNDDFQISHIKCHGRKWDPAHILGAVLHLKKKLQ